MATKSTKRHKKEQKAGERFGVRRFTAALDVSPFPLGCQGQKERKAKRCSSPALQRGPSFPPLWMSLLFPLAVRARRRERQSGAQAPHSKEVPPSSSFSCLFVLFVAIVFCPVVLT